MADLDNYSIEVLSKNFELASSPDFKVFREILTQRIAYLIKYDFENLLWILYRIDVDENSAMAVLADKETINQAELLTDLIIQRQITKAETRQKYKSKNEGEGDY
jgi:hypothetical protein